MKDLFQFPDEIPQEVTEILDKYDLSAMSYEDCKNMLVEVEKIGYTFDYGLSAEPYDLMRIKTPEENNQLLANFLHGNGAIHPNQYNENWNEIMQVVEKIENLRKDKEGYSDLVAYVRIENTYCEIAFVDQIQEKAIFYNAVTKIEAVFLTCLKFITWYNLYNEKFCTPPLEIKVRDRIAIVNHDINSIKKHR